MFGIGRHIYQPVQSEPNTRRDYSVQYNAEFMLILEIKVANSIFYILVSDILEGIADVMMSLLLMML